MHSLSPSVDPRDLLSAHRFDLGAKLAYARFYAQGRGSRAQRRIYLNHEEVFNGFVEADGSGKIGPDRFVAEFDDLIDDLEHQGFKESGAIPVGSNAVLIDGAHRVAASVILGIPVATLTDPSPASSYDWEYFIDNGLSQSDADAMAVELCLAKQDAFLVILYPSHDVPIRELVDIISGEGTVFYRRAFDMTREGATAIVREVYWDEPWVGSRADPLSGAHSKASMCFSRGSEITILAVESDGNAMLRAKEAVRERCGVSNHSIHTTDTHSEVQRLAPMLLHAGSMQSLDVIGTSSTGWFDKLLDELQAISTRAGVERDRIALCGSAVLAALGIRDVRDLDYFIVGDDPIAGIYKEIDCHNSHSAEYGFEPDELVYDPSNYFWHRGFKFVSPQIVLEMKRRRNEPKDAEDAESLDRVLSGSPMVPQRSWRRMIKPRYWKAQARLLALKARFHLTRLRHRIRS